MIIHASQLAFLDDFYPDFRSGFTLFCSLVPETSKVP